MPCRQVISNPFYTLVRMWAPRFWCTLTEYTINPNRADLHQLPQINPRSAPAKSRCGRRSSNSDAAFAESMLAPSQQDLISCDMRSINAELALTIALTHTSTNYRIQIEISHTCTELQRVRIDK